MFGDPQNLTIENYHDRVTAYGSQPEPQHITITVLVPYGATYDSEAITDAEHVSGLTSKARMRLQSRLASIGLDVVSVEAQ